MEKQVNVKLILGTMCAVMIIMLTVAFAHFSRMLKTAGQAAVDPANFDIHFKNLSEPVLHGGAEVTGVPSIANEGASINNIAVTLKLPGDYVLYTVDIENSGDINVEVSNIEHTDLDNSLLELEVIYTDTGDRLQTGDELSPGQKKNITIKIKYKDIENPDLLPQTVQTVNFSYSVTYSQSNKSQYAESGIPKSYTQLEYLESTGTQWIDTGIKLNQDSRVKIKYQYTDLNATARIFGTMQNENNTGWIISTVDGLPLSKIQTLYGDDWKPSEYDISNVIPSTNIVEYERNAKYQYVNGESYYTNGNKNFTTSSNVIAFGAYYNQIKYAKARIYEISIWQDGITISRNLIPSLDSNGRPCMYDTVTKQPFYNDGTGEFLYYNPNDLPKIFTELEYLESTGTQYIDIGIKLNQDSRVKIKYQYTDLNATARIFGTMQNENNTGWIISTVDGLPLSKIQTLYGDDWKPSEYDISNVIPSTNIVEYERNAKYQYVNGESYYTNGNKNFTTSSNVIAFGAYYNQIKYAKARIYEISIWQDGITISRNLIPSLDPDGRPCMYDTVTKQPFYNYGTGEFLYGLKQ